MKKKIKEAVRQIVESCDATGSVPADVKDALADQKVQAINEAIERAREEGREEARKENLRVVAEAEENGFKRGVDAGVDQAQAEVDEQGEQYYTFIIELIRAIDTLQKLMVKIARAESYLEGYNKGKEEAGAASSALGGEEGEEGLADGLPPEGGAEGGEGLEGAEGAEGEPPPEGDGGETEEDKQVLAQAESTLAQKFKKGSKLLIESTSQYLDKRIAEVLTESVVVDRGELEHLRMVVESIRNNIVVGDDRVTDYLTKIDRTRRQELMESRKESERLRKENLILESTNKRLSAKQLLMEKTENLPSFERRRMRDAFRGVEDATLISESFDEKFREMKRDTAKETAAKFVRRPVATMVNESIDKKPVERGETKRVVVNESIDPTVASVVKSAAATMKQYSRKV